MSNLEQRFRDGILAYPAYLVTRYGIGFQWELRDLEDSAGGEGQHVLATGSDTQKLKTVLTGLIEQGRCVVNSEDDCTSIQDKQENGRVVLRLRNLKHKEV